MTTLTIERYASPSLAGLLRFPRAKAAPVSNVDKPATLTIPAGIDGLLHEREGVLRVVSATEERDGTRHQYLITYAWRDAPRYDGGYVYRHFGLYNVILGVRPKQRPRFQILSCNCPCCFRHNAPSCRHCVAADDALNCPPVKGYLLNRRPGQTQPTEMSRSLTEGKDCGRCGAGHPLRRTNLYFVPLGYLSILSCPHCGEWRIS